MRALLYADGGPDCGLGHQRRTAALAHALQARGWSCAFLHGSPAGRLPALPEVPDLFVLDSYEVPNDEVRRSLPARDALVLAFDDDMSRAPVADVVLSSGAGAESWPWPARDRVVHLLGPRYHPLPAEYLPLRPREVASEVRRVLVTFGGSGTAALVEAALAAVRRACPAAEVDAVLGPFLAAPSLRPDAGVRVHGATDRMCALLSAADLAVAGAGQTLFELAATGTPAVAVSLAANQEPNVRWMAEAGTALDAGRADGPGLEGRLAAALLAAAPRQAREAMARKGQALIDGQGAFRVEEALSALVARRRTAP